MVQRTEQELFLLMQGSSYPAFEELYNRLFKTLFKLALKKIGNADDAARPGAGGVYGILG